jgi:hypothetical protein
LHSFDGVCYDFHNIEAPHYRAIKADRGAAMSMNPGTLSGIRVAVARQSCYPRLRARYVATCEDPCSPVPHEVVLGAEYRTRQYLQPSIAGEDTQILPVRPAGCATSRACRQEPMLCALGVSASYCDGEQGVDVSEVQTLIAAFWLKNMTITQVSSKQCRTRSTNGSAGVTRTETRTVGKNARR